MATRFGKYIVESEIGRGGFGRVYRAFDADMNRRVAIKILVCESDPDLLSRFQAEAGMTASLAHKNIVTVFEFAHQDGCPYLVMELLEGRTLHEMIAAGESLPLLEKVEIMHQVAEGLQHAHARGVIHRDIKPGNIMVLSDGRVKIMDFGIARVLNKDGVRRTREGDLIGTVPYMAPEIFRDHQPDKKTDIFAYGVLYYELLTGEHPFQAPDPYAAMTRILNEDPTPVNRNVSNCPEGLGALIQRLLMKDRLTRFDELNDVLFDSEPVLRELRQERAAALAQEVEPLLTGGNYETAYSRVKKILDLDPARNEARVWLDQIRTQVNRQRADKLRQQGQEHMSAMRFRDAVTCFESALHLESTKSEILALLGEARAALERSRHLAELLVTARSERQKGQLEQALSHASQAAELDPSSGEAASLLHSLRRQMRELRMRSLLIQAEELRSHSRFDEALGVLDQVDPLLRNHNDINAVRSRIIRERTEMEHRRRLAQFRDAFNKAQEVLAARRLEEALNAAETLCQKFPEQTAAEEFRNQVCRRMEVQRRTLEADARKRADQQDQRGLQELVVQIQQALARDHLGTAELLISKADRSFPGEAIWDSLKQDLSRRYDLILRDMQRVEAERNTPERAHKSEPNTRELARTLEELRQAAEERAKREIDEQLRRPSEKASGPVLSRKTIDPGEQKQPSSRGKQVKSRKTRDEVISDGREKAAALAAEGNLLSAAAVLESLSKRYPNSSDVRRDLDAAKRELNYRRDHTGYGTEGRTWAKRRQQIEKQGREAAALLKDGDFSGAVALIKGLLKSS